MGKQLGTHNEYIVNYKTKSNIDEAQEEKTPERLEGDEVSCAFQY